MASNDAIIHYLKQNVENLHARAKRIESNISSGMTLTEWDLSDLARANSIAMASNRVMEIFSNASFNRDLTKNRLKTAVEYMFDEPEITVHHLKVYNVVINSFENE